MIRLNSTAFLLGCLIAGTLAAQDVPPQSPAPEVPAKIRSSLIVQPPKTPQAAGQPANLDPKGDAKPPTAAQTQLPPHVQRMREELRRKLDLPPNDLIKLARTIAGNIRATVRHDAAVARKEQNEEELDGMRRTLLNHKEQMQMDFDRMRKELDIRLGEVREQFVSSPQESDDQQRRVIARYSPSLLKLKDQMAGIAMHIDTLNQRLAGVRTDLARRTLERDLERHDATLQANSSINNAGLQVTEILKQLDEKPASPLQVEVADESEPVDIPADTSSVDELLKRLDGNR